MVRKTKQEAEATKEAILIAAAKLFVESGVAKTSLEGIAREAGVTRGAVYWHFKNKVDIFAALHEQVFEAFCQIMLDGLEKNHPHPLKQLEELCIDLLLDLERNPQKRRILTICFLKCDYSGEMEPFLQDQHDQRLKSLALISRYFERAKTLGELPSCANPCALTHGLLCFITGVAFEYLRYPDLMDLHELAEALVRQFFNGMVYSVAKG